jgi:hypothetical protein
MPLRPPALEELEPRLGPAVVTDDSGWAMLSQWGQPLPDYHLGYNAAAVERSAEGLGLQWLALAPAAGGGPRLIFGRVDRTQEGGGQYPIRGGFDVFAFEPSFRGGLAVALGDLTGDGIPDPVVGSGPGGGPRVKAYDGATGEVLADFFAYDPNFLGGVSVAVEGGEIWTAPGAGGGPHVRRFGPDGSDRGGFLAGDPAARGGLLVATGDVVGFDGRPEVVTLAGRTLAAWTPAGRLLSSYPVLADVPGPATLAVGYLGSQFVPQPAVAAGGVVATYDLDPVFGGRETRRNDYAESYGRPVEVRVGTARQLDGLARYDRAGAAGATLSGTLPLLAGYPLTAAFDFPPGGAAIGPAGERKIGTLAGYVRDGDQVLALTNRHVAGDPGSVVDQPAGVAGARRLGTVVRATPDTPGVPLTADAALVRLDDPGRYDPRSAVGDRLVRPHGLDAARRGELVYAVSFWGVTEGLVVETGAGLAVNDGGRKFLYTGQTLAVSADDGSGWLKPGDSGSLVLRPDGTRVGLAFAGGAFVGVFTPLAAVFAALGTDPVFAA